MPIKNQLITTSDLDEYLSKEGGNITGNLSVSGIITGNLSGNSDTATKLATARTIRTNLASTSTASFDGTNNITPGVTGVLPVANGGTGSSTEKYLKLTGGNLTGNLTVSGKNVVRSINGTNADINGNVSISSSFLLGDPVPVVSTSSYINRTYETRVSTPNYGSKWLVSQGDVEFKSESFTDKYTLSYPLILNPNTVITSKSSYSVNYNVASSTIYCYRIN